MIFFNPIYPKKKYIPPKGELITGSFRYQSSIDPAIDRLYAKYAYIETEEEQSLPIVLLIHGYSQSANSMTEFIMQDMASYGFFACSVGMRGRHDDDSEPDVSGRELYDIYDAVVYIKENHGAVVDETNVNASGYSGGGGNVMGLAVKFPDTFRVLASHFGIVDYGYDSTDSWWMTNPNRQESLTDWIGYTRDENIQAYHSRDHSIGLGTNFSGGKLFLFHDAEDTNVPPVNSERAAQSMQDSERNNYMLSITDTNDETRWLHDSPHEDSPVRQSRDYWGQAIVNNEVAAWEIPASGKVVVQGYIRTKHFEIWLGNGQEEIAEVTYDIAMDEYRVIPLTGEMGVSITQGEKTASQTIIEETQLTVS